MDIAITRYSMLLAACVAVVSGCKHEAPPTAEARPVRSVIVTTANASSSNSYTAEIRSRFETDLSFQVSGKLVARAVDVGTNVRKGMLLARLDETDQHLGVEAARSALTAAVAELDRVRTEELRYRDLIERGLTTRANYLAQQTAVKTAQSKVEQATADLRLNEQRQGYTTLRADEDGVVTRVFAEPGAVVSAGQRVLSIARPGELEAAFDVSESQIEEFRKIPTVQVVLLSAPTIRYPARVREISPSADPVTRTYQVKTTLLQPAPALRLGMTVTVLAAGASEVAAISLPATALFQQGRTPAVWVINEDKTLALRPVDVERYDSDRILVRSGLAAGERIVTAGVHRLSAGDHVRLLEEVSR